MTTAKTELRRCTGSTRFGIEPHEAPVSAFPKQPSQQDGLGRMCTDHWKAYTTGLRRDTRAREAGSEATTGSANESTPSPTIRKPRPARRSPTKSQESTAKVGEVERTEALISEVDTMPAGAMVERVGEADVRTALETSATARMLAD